MTARLELRSRRDEPLTCRHPPAGAGPGPFYARTRLNVDRSSSSLFLISFQAAFLCLQYICNSIFGAGHLDAGQRERFEANNHFRKPENVEIRPRYTTPRQNHPPSPLLRPEKPPAKSTSIPSRNHPPSPPSTSCKPRVHLRGLPRSHARTEPTHWRLAGDEGVASVRGPHSRGFAREPPHPHFARRLVPRRSSAGACGGSRAPQAEPLVRSRTPPRPTPGIGRGAECRRPIGRRDTSTPS